LLHGTKRKVLALSVRAYAIAMGDAPFGYFMWERHSPEWRLGIANREIGVPGAKNQNGEPGGSPFQRFWFSPSRR